MEPSSTEKKFGTFNGVFRPTILTILGVMMYLREGWLVGNAGLVGGILVILACYLITGTTALSISSITTNIRVGSGGVFAIISQSLGLEVGGAVGIPLYLAQGLSVALYISGFVETWMFIFPEHQRIIVVLVVFSLAFIISFFGAQLVFRVQFFVMLGTVAALISMLVGLPDVTLNTSPRLWGDFPEANMQELFAIFFPAATGIMVGASMSGSLTTPRRSIPRGTMSAWALSGVIYLFLAVWYALTGTSEELCDTTRIFAVDHAFNGTLVLVGIMSSCFSATLSSMVAAPRVLQSLAIQRIVPMRNFLARESNGDPRNATIFTAALSLVALLLGDLDTLAPVLTMFFLVIYFMINMVLFIEHRLKMVSFRPIFRIPGGVPLLGSLASLTAILIISPIMGFMAIAFCLGIYVYLDHKRLQTPWETVHSGIFTGIAHWAAKKVMQNDANGSLKRSWKPDMLVPVERSLQLEGLYRILKALTTPRGSVQVANFRKQDDPQIQAMISEFSASGLFATSATIEDHDFLAGMRTCVSVMSGSFFKPNTLFTPLEGRSCDELQTLMNLARESQMGVVFLGVHPEAGFGRENTVNLWIRDQSPDWRIGLQLANLDYAFLMGIQLQTNWKARVRLISVVEKEEHIEQARDYITTLLEYARMSRHMEVVVEGGNFFEYLDKAPRADLNIFGLSTTVDKELMEKLVNRTGSSCLFVLDSGNESALA